MSDWKIGHSAWIIQDGNYGDFQCHEQANFALEFFPLSCRVSSSTEKKAIWLSASKYKVNAEVTFVGKGCFVIDFGVLAYQNADPPETIGRGMWLEAEIYLGIDPFFYIEDLAHVEGMPPLIYAWQIQKIGLETAPFIETVDARGIRIMIRDETKSAPRDVQQTDAWKDDNGNAEYVLDCTLMDVPPTRDRR